jgi:CRISPR-associated protein Csh2
VKLSFIKGTTVMPSEKKKIQGTFTEQYVLPYSLIGFYGIVNENAGVYTNLTNGDVALLLEALWNGTKNLISRTKVGQMPRLLIRVIYTEKNYHIGDLTTMIRLESSLEDEEIRDVTDYKLDLTDLMKVFIQNKEKIEMIEFIADDRIVFIAEGKEESFENLVKKLGITTKVLKF